MEIRALANLLEKCSLPRLHLSTFTDLKMDIFIITTPSQHVMSLQTCLLFPILIGETLSQNRSISSLTDNVELAHFQGLASQCDAHYELDAQNKFLDCTHWSRILLLFATST